MYQIEISNRQTSLPFANDPLRRAIAAVLEGEGIRQAEISLAIVSDSEIHALNRRFLGHDEPTDVLSFLLETGPDRLEGEVVVSAETAQDRCQEFGWSAVDELTLYVIHGTLHLVGYLDQSEQERMQMREREQHYLKQLGIGPSVGPTAGPASAASRSEEEGGGSPT